MLYEIIVSIYVVSALVMACIGLYELYLAITDDIESRKAYEKGNCSFYVPGVNYMDILGFLLIIFMPFFNTYVALALLNEHVVEVWLAKFGQLLSRPVIPRKERDNNGRRN